MTSCHPGTRRSPGTITSLPCTVAAFYGNVFQRAENESRWALVGPHGLLLMVMSGNNERAARVFQLVANSLCGREEVGYTGQRKRQK